MKRTMARTFLAALLLVTAGLGAAAARQDSMAAARELYTTAAYEDALAMLDRLRGAEPSATDARAIEQFRAFSLFALARTNEAEKAIEAIVAVDPTWTLPDTEAPPRIIGLFSSVRERVLPVVIRQRFAAAKDLYAAKQHDEAVEAFSSLILLLEHQAIVKVAGVDLADLKTVAGGFRDLAKAASDQAKAAAEQAARAAAQKVVEETAATQSASLTASAGAPPPAVAGSTNGAQAQPTEPVLPPSIITQQVPRPVGTAVPLGREAVVVLDVLVDELGRVERATIRQSVNRAYEAQLIAAARGWRYTPATQAGKPVKYVKTLEITLTPR
jgi:TonB family protein